jgi:hypothetical protein
VLVAHSLGSVAAVDLLSQDLCGCAGLVTLGSPLGIRGIGLNFRARLPAASALDGLPWRDVYSPHDLVVTGSVAGMALPGVSGAHGLQALGYPCRSSVIDLGSNPVGAHLGYWRSRHVAAWVLELATA